MMRRIMLVIGIVACVTLATMEPPPKSINFVPDALPPGWSVVPPPPPGYTPVPDINADDWCWWPAANRVTVEGMRLLHDSDLKMAVALGLIDPDSLMPMTKLLLGLDPAKSYRCKHL